jgi:hypothetical protein
MCYEMLEWNGDAVAFVRPLFAVVHIAPSITSHPSNMSNFHMMQWTLGLEVLCCLACKNRNSEFETQHGNVSSLCFIGAGFVVVNGRRRYFPSPGACVVKSLRQVMSSCWNSSVPCIV